MRFFKKLIVILIAILIIVPYSSVFALDTGITFDQKIGMNGFVDCRLDNLKAGGTLREYHNFGWTYDANSGKCYFKSSWFDFDEFYKNVYNEGITILPCIQQGNNKENREYKPVENGANTTDPLSYKIHSNVLFNYAARYGYSKVDESKLNLTTGTEAKTGLGYIQYYENWNEPDKTWIGEKACFSPEEFAAMCSADYDGHEGLLGDTYGIKQADSNAKLVYGGLAGGSAGVNYLKRMKTWSEENRPSKTLPFDAINFHMYCGTKSPEASSFVESATALINWRNENAPDKEIWITEFGWDTNTSSPRSAPSYDTQRDWIIREYLIADRVGLDRATVYTSRDDADSSNTTQYATSGLTTQKGKEERKSSWYGVNTLKTTLKGFTLSKVVKEDSNLYIYKYSNPTTNEDCFVLWSPTENGSKIENYELSVGKVKDATLTELKDKEENGISTNLTIENNSVKVDVSESPIFIKVKNVKNEENENTEPTQNENNNNDDNTETLILKSNKYKIGFNNVNKYEDGDKYLYRVDQNITLKKLKEDIETNGTITVYNKSKTPILEDTIIGTGMILKIERNNEHAELTISVKGDVDGNGKTTATDLATITMQLMKEIDLQNELFMSLDINSDNKITATDLAAVNQIILKELDLSTVK